MLVLCFKRYIHFSDNGNNVGNCFGNCAHNELGNIVGNDNEGDGMFIPNDKHLWLCVCTLSGALVCVLPCPSMSKCFVHMSSVPSFM